MALTCPDFDEIYTRHHDTVYRLCYLLVPDQKIAMDCTFRVFLRIGAVEKSFPSPDAEQRFLIQKCLSVCKAFYRKKMHRLPPRPQLAQIVPFPLTDTMWKLLKSPLDRRAGVFCMALCGYTLSETAALLRVPAFLLSPTATDEVKEALSSLTISEDTAAQQLDDIYFRFSERSVGFENKIHDFLERLDQIVLLLAAAAVLLGIFSVWLVSR